MQWQIQGRGQGGLGPPLFLDQTEPGPMGQKNSFETAPLSLDDHPDYLKVWIHHWSVTIKLKLEQYLEQLQNTGPYFKVLNRSGSVAR